MGHNLDRVNDLLAIRWVLLDVESSATCAAWQHADPLVLRSNTGAYHVWCRLGRRRRPLNKKATPLPNERRGPAMSPDLHRDTHQETGGNAAILCSLVSSPDTLNAIARHSYSPTPNGLQICRINQSP